VTLRLRAASTAADRELPAFTIRRSTGARRVRLRVTRDGEAIVTLPTRAPEALAVDLVRTKAAWIHRHQIRLREAQERIAARPSLENGRSLLLRGVPVGVDVETVPRVRRTRIEASPDGRRLTVRLDPGDERPVGTILEAWLRAEARCSIEVAIARHAPALTVRPARVAVRDQSSRWGSASRRGTLSFSWRLVLAPPDVLDYVVIHELAHLRDLSHSERYWRLVHAHTPHVASARRWLREHETELRHALD
jgi:predicted metal-dependent hydrolase